MQFLFEIAGDQISGARDYQEDAFLTSYVDDQTGETSGKSAALIIVADGMGGHAAGNIASNLVVSTFSKNFTANYSPDTIAPVLRESLEEANKSIRESIDETPALHGMGCTMVAAFVRRGKLHWVSVGDSHLYRVRDGAIEKRNDDHSYGGYLDRMIAEGAEIEAEPGLSRNMLMSAMTGDEIAEIDCPSEGIQLLPGDRIIVASDGVDSIGPDRIKDVAAYRWTSKECVRELLEAVKAAGNPRQDNTTIVVLDVFELDDPAPVVAKKVEQAGAKGRTTLQMQGAASSQDATVPAASISAAAGKKPRKSSAGPVVAGVIVAAAVIGGGAWYYLQTQKDPAPIPVEVTTDPNPTTTPPQDTRPNPSDLAPLKSFSDTLSSGAPAPVMLELPATSFDMGSSNLSMQADERPRHRVDTKAFAIGKHELTVAEFRAFAQAKGVAVPPGDALQPVRGVSAATAEAYVGWLSEQTGKRYRLPSEAEWELAASAGNRQPYWWGREFERGRAQCFDCLDGPAPSGPASVGSFEPNPFGLHDTAGNVSEWVADCFHPTYQGAPADGSAWDGGDCSKRIARGGAWSNTGSSIRSTKRIVLERGDSVESVGLRVARDL